MTIFIIIIIRTENIIFPLIVGISDTRILENPEENITHNFSFHFLALAFWP